MPNNKLLIYNTQLNQYRHEVPAGLEISIQGENNIVKIIDGFKFSKTKIIISGNNNAISIGIGADIKETQILMDHNVDSRKLIIGKNFSCNGAMIVLNESKDNIEIGDNCMFSFGIQIRAEDGHAIFDESSKLLINKGGFVKIGNHVWICSNAMILKNTIINDDSIVAAGAIVTKQFESKNIILGGNPAKIIKTNVNWSRQSAEQYLKNISD